jgi:hypothetical protein
VAIAHERSTADGERGARAGRLPSWMAFTLPVTWAALAGALPMLVALLTRLNSVDLAYQLRLGEGILRAKAIPSIDALTFTSSAASSGASWIDQQWGAQVLLALAFRSGGWEALAVLRAVVVTGTFLLVYCACRESGAAPRVAAVLTLAGFVVARPGLTLRPQLFGLFLVGLTLWLLAARRRRPALVAAIPVVAAAWASLHGSFVLAPILVALAWIDDRRTSAPGARRIGWIALASAAATICNPYGVRAWSYVVEITTNPTIRATIAEWQPPSIHDAGGIGFYSSAAAAALVLVWIRRRASVPWSSLATLGGLFLLGAAANRSVLLWAVVAPVVIAGLVPPPRADPLEERSLVSTAVVGSLAMAIVLASPGVIRSWGSTYWLPSDAPLPLTARLAQIARPGDRAFVAQPWASWFEQAAPELRVFVDSRIELFDPSIWRQYRNVMAGRAGWQAVLRTWGVDFVVLPRGDATTAARLSGDAGWRPAYRGPDGMILIKSSASRP